MNQRSEAEKWVRSHINNLRRHQKNDRKYFAVLSLFLSFINILVLILAIIALNILVKNSTQAGIGALIVMASLAAASTILLFIINTLLIIYRGFMKVDIYKNAMDAIQKEFMTFKLKQNEYQQEQNNQLFNQKCQEIFDKAISAKRKTSMTKMLLKALSGGDNE